MTNTKRQESKAESIDVPYFDTCVELQKYVTLNTKTTWVYYKHRTEEIYTLDLFKIATDNNFGTTKELDIIPAPTFTELMKNTQGIKITIENNNITISITEEETGDAMITKNIANTYHFSEVLSNVLINNIMFNFKDL